MIETLVIDYLSETLKNVSIYAEVPANAPTEFVVVEKTGSSRENYVESATFAIQSYSDSLANAAALNDLVKAAMYEIITEDEFSAVRLNSDYNFTDTASKRYRYQAVFVLTAL